MTKREFQKADYEAEVFGYAIEDSQPMEDGTHRVTVVVNEPKMCRTCHWWFQGDCVFHTGMIGSPKSKMKFRGILRTAADFGCTEWQKDERPTIGIDSRSSIDVDSN